MVKLKVGDYLKASDIKTGDVAEIIDGGEERQSQFTYEDGTPKTQFTIGVSVNGSVKKWSMNKTTQRALSAEWSNDTEKWIGKKCNLKVIEQLVGKELKKIIFGEPSEDKGDW